MKLGGEKDSQSGNSKLPGTNIYFLMTSKLLLRKSDPLSYKETRDKINEGKESIFLFLIDVISNRSQKKKQQCAGWLYVTVCRQREYVLKWEKWKHSVMRLSSHL